MSLSTFFMNVLSDQFQHDATKLTFGTDTNDKRDNGTLTLKGRVITFLSSRLITTSNSFNNNAIKRKLHTTTLK